MVRSLLAPVVTVAACLVLAGCGNADTGARADDPAPTSGSTPAGTPTPTGTPTTTGPAQPSGTPTGRYPSFAPQDYSYTLAVTCFCADAGTPIRVTVTRGVAVAAVYLADGRGVSAGDAPERLRWLTIDDVITLADAADPVDVTWPLGQDYPSSVSITQGDRLADATTTYAVSDVEAMKQLN